MKNSILFFALILMIHFGWSQNVGIGTNTPTSPLTVVVPTNKGITQIKGTVELGFYTSSSSAYFQTWSNHNLHFATNSASAQLSILTSGNIGIGTAAPTQSLDVEGTIRLRGGNPGQGSILTTMDANGNVEWKPTGTVGAKTIFIPFAAFVGSSAYMGHEPVNNNARKASGYLSNEYRYQAPLLLPVGTVIKEITWHYFDNHVSLNLDFALVRDFFGSVANISQTSSGGAINADMSKKVTVNHTLENYFYWIDIGTFSWSPADELRFKGALITYE